MADEKTYEQKLKELSIQYQAKTLADLLISFRKTYQDIFIQSHIKLNKTTEPLANYYK
jgi:hypothetical protein